MFSSSYRPQDDSLFINESLAFYMSTNTFRNPIFDMHFDGSDEVTPAFDPERPPSAERRRPMAAQVTGTKWNNFCDNLSYSIRDKAFVLELNFKNRLRGLRKFLHRNMPWILVALHKIRHAELRQTRMTTSAAQQQAASSRMATRQDQRSLSDLNFHSQQQPRRPPSYGCQNDELDQLDYADDDGYRDTGALFWHQLEVPRSAEALSIQQEHILSRLDRAKRERQKLLENLASNSSFKISHLEGQLGARNWTHISGRGRSQCDVQSGHVPAVAGAALSSMVVDRAATSHRLGEFVDGTYRAANGPTTTEETSKATAPTTTKLPSRVNLARRTRNRWISGEKQFRNATRAFTSNNKKLCIICYANIPNIVTLPCKHHDICSDCFIETIYMAVKHNQYPLKCVLCRQKIERIRCSRSLLLSIIERNRNKC